MAPPIVELVVRPQPAYQRAIDWFVGIVMMPIYWVLAPLEALTSGAGLGPGRPTHRVVVRNAQGRERTVALRDSLDEASARRRELEHELDTVGLTEWAARHQIPGGFFDRST